MLYPELVKFDDVAPPCVDVGIFIQYCKDGDISRARFLYDKDSSVMTEESFNWCCSNGHLDLAKWMLEVSPGLVNRPSWSLGIVCQYGHLDILQWLLTIYPITGGGGLFFTSCVFGNLDIAKYLLELDSNFLNAAMPVLDIFVIVCENGHLAVARWLWELLPPSNSNPISNADKMHNAHFELCIGNVLNRCNGKHDEIVRWLVEVSPFAKALMSVRSVAT